MLLASNFEQGVDLWRPVNFAGSVTAARVSDRTAYSGTAYYRVGTTAPRGSVAHDLSILRQIPGTANFSADANIAVQAWVRGSSPGGPNMRGTLTVWQLGTALANSTQFDVNHTWTLVSNSLGMTQLPPYTVRVEFYLESLSPAALDIDCVFVN